jgi:hypothetical protein
MLEWRSSTQVDVGCSSYNHKDVAIVYTVQDAQEHYVRLPLKKCILDTSYMYDETLQRL